MFDFFKKFFIKKEEPTNKKTVVSNGKWQLVGKTYASPVPYLNIPKEVIGESLERLINGCTTLVWQEEKTGEVKTVVILGTDEDKLETLAAKALVEGMQYFTVNGQTFAIAVWVPKE